jgi:hypothetical protein
MLGSGHLGLSVASDPFRDYPRCALVYSLAPVDGSSQAEETH